MLLQGYNVNVICSAFRNTLDGPFELQLLCIFDMFLSSRLHNKPELEKILESDMYKLIRGELQMDRDLIIQLFEEITTDIMVNTDGTTNKKCPLCGNDILIFENGNSGTIKCKTENCFLETYRGL